MPNSPGRIKILLVRTRQQCLPGVEVVNGVLAVPKVSLAVVSILALFESR